MKVIRARISTDMEKNIHTLDWSAFQFPSEEDEHAFRQLMPSIDAFYYQYKGKTLCSHSNAWSFMTALGWIMDEYDPEDYLMWKFPENNEESLELALKHFDWYYEYSDDANVWRRGSYQEAHIKFLMKMIPDKGKELWDKYCPKGWTK